MYNRCTSILWQNYEFIFDFSNFATLVSNLIDKKSDSK